MFPLAWEGFGLHFVSLLAWAGFGQHTLRCILYPRWHGMGLVNECWDTFYVLDGMGRVWSTNVEIHFLSSLALLGFGQHNFRYNLSFLAWEEFVQHKFRYIYGPRFKGGVWSKEVEVHFVNMLALEGFFNACWDAFYVIAFMGSVSSTHVDI